MKISTPSTHGTCVIGELTNLSAFASVAYEGGVWAKRYPALTEAVAEVRRLGLVDRLFAIAAPKYIQQTRAHCVSPLTGKLDRDKLTAAGFRLTGNQVLA